ncbi:MAG TPA: hypothetical protein VHE81_19530 [Lacipirellulaceae bacterium]|nr:hypothetical protein [Lacipirellulaceae bacterium]
MQRTLSQYATLFGCLIKPDSMTKCIHWVVLACATNLFPTVTIAGPYVEFDIAPMAECRDVTPPQRIAQYPNERLIEVSLPISARFRGVSMDDVDELDIEVNGAAAGLRVEDFSPTTQLASDISHDIETTTTTTTGRSLDGSLGGTFPVPGADAVAHLTPTISGGITGCDTSTEKINRLPPKHAVVVSGTSSEGRGVFFKLKRYSQTSLEGVHQLSVTFVAPRFWQWSEIRVACTAHGERKLLWIKQTGIVGQTNRAVQLVRTSPKPVRQVVLKPTENNQTVTKSSPANRKTAKAATGWRAATHKSAAAKVSVRGTGEQASQTNAVNNAGSVERSSN